MMCIFDSLWQVFAKMMCPQFELPSMFWLIYNAAMIVISTLFGVCTFCNQKPDHSKIIDYVGLAGATALAVYFWPVTALCHICHRLFV